MTKNCKSIWIPEIQFKKLRERAREKGMKMYSYAAELIDRGIESEEKESDVRLRTVTK